jgi:hypothetical protein
MKKNAAVSLLILNLLLLTCCQGEKANFLFVPSFKTDRPVAYTFTEPKPFALPAYQYKVQEIPLKAKQTYELLKPYLAAEYASDHKVSFDYSLFSLETKSRKFYADDLPYAMDYNLKGEQLALLSKPSQDALAALGWETESAPCIFTSFQDSYTYQAGTLQARPLTFEYFKYIFNVPYDDIFYAAVYRPLLKGYPVYRFIEKGTEDQAALNYASFWLSKEGKIITGTIHAGYEVIKEAPIPTELIPWEKAVETVVQYAIQDDKRFPSNEAYNLSYDVKRVEPCYMVDTNYVAVPGWEITLRKLSQEKATGITYYLDWVAAVNAVTGQLV